MQAPNNLKVLLWLGCRKRLFDVTCGVLVPGAFVSSPLSLVRSSNPLAKYYVIVMQQFASENTARGGARENLGNFLSIGRRGNRSQPCTGKGSACMGNQSLHRGQRSSGQHRLPLQILHLVQRSNTAGLHISGLAEGMSTSRRSSTDIGKWHRMYTNVTVQNISSAWAPTASRSYNRSQVNYVVPIFRICAPALTQVSCPAATLGQIVSCEKNFGARCCPLWPSHIVQMYDVPRIFVSNSGCKTCSEPLAGIVAPVVVTTVVALYFKGAKN